MVLVRKSELACRNSWDQDLWELADQPIDLQPSAHIPLPLGGGEPTELTAARADQLAEDVTRAGEMFTDRITSISMPTRSQLRPGRFEQDQQIDDAADVDQSDARSSVREARKRRQEQRYLERRKHQETVLKRVDDLLDAKEPRDDVDREMLRVRAVDGPMTAIHVDNNTRSNDRRGAGADGNNQSQRGGDRRKPPRQETPPIDSATGSNEPISLIEFRANPRSFRGDAQSPPSNAAPASADAAPAKPATNATMAQVPNGIGGQSAFKHNRTEPLPSAIELSAALDQQRVTQTADPTSSEPRSLSSQSVPDPATGTMSHKDESVVVSPAVEPRPTKWFTGAGYAQPEAITDVARPFAVDPIDLSRDLKSVRRCCATCRDFKQVGDGRTGWCNNAYAFSERRMVQSDELACRSSLGFWWLPHDDLWLEYADTTHHGRPTPLLDDMIGATPVDRQRMGQRST